MCILQNGKMLEGGVGAGVGVFIMIFVKMDNHV